MAWTRWLTLYAPKVCWINKSINQATQDCGPYWVCTISYVLLCKGYVNQRMATTRSLTDNQVIDYKQWKKGGVGMNWFTTFQIAGNRWVFCLSPRIDTFPLYRFLWMPRYLTTRGIFLPWQFQPTLCRRQTSVQVEVMALTSHHTVGDLVNQITRIITTQLIDIALI